MNPFIIVEIKCTVILESLLKAMWLSYACEAKKDKEHYRINLLVDWENIGIISIDGKWNDEDKYIVDVLDISHKYLHTYFSK